MASKTGAVGASVTPAPTDATFKKEERAREGAKAMEEYLANGVALRERMAELRALRLAKEAAKDAADKARVSRLLGARRRKG